MRFNIGDILEDRYALLYVWKVVDIADDKYVLHSARRANMDFSYLGSFREDQIATLQLYEVVAQPVREEITIYILIYANNAGIKSTYSNLEKELVMRYKEATERLGYTTLAMKKFKTRI